MSRAKGYILLPVALAIALVAVCAILVNREAAVEVAMTAAAAEARVADNVARAGLEHALWRARAGACGGDTTLPTTAFGPHTYTATVTPQVTTTRTEIAPDRDAWIKEADPTGNFGGDGENLVQNKTGDDRRALYHFDTSAIAPGSPVASATLRLRVTAGDDLGSVGLHEVTAAWAEGSVTWNDVATELEPFPVAVIPPRAAAGWVEVNVTTTVQRWVNDPAGNFGLALLATSVDKESKYTAKEHADASLRPRLDVVTTAAPASPATVQATATLASGAVRTVTRAGVTLRQPASSVDLQPGAAVGVDAYVWKAYPNTNYATDDETWVATSPPGNNDAQALFRFGVSAIPPGAEIIGATLSVHHRDGNDPGVPVTAHRITSAWDEATVTWNDRDGANAWATPGGDHDPAAISTTSVGPASMMRYEWDLTPLVAGWVSGAYPNHGVLLKTAAPSIFGERFDTSDHADPARHPRLTVTYACACGSACLVPAGSGSVLLVVSSAASPLPADVAKKSLFEAWGYTVDLIADGALSTTFDAEIATHDVVYVSETVNGVVLDNKVSNAPVGVVSEEGWANDTLGIATSYANPVGGTIDLTDTTHFITSPFPAGALAVYDLGMEGLTVGGALSPGLATLAEQGGVATLTLLEAGAAEVGGGTTPGRRAMLFLGRDGSSFDWNLLNANGRLLVQRAIEWGRQPPPPPPPDRLLFVVPSALLPSLQDLAKRSLMQSWGFDVSLIGVNTSQAAFDDAVAVNDVVFVTENIDSSDLGTKLTGAAIGVVTEEANVSDELGLAETIAWSEDSAIVIEQNTHYITSPFGLGPVTLFAASESLASMGGDLAVDLATLGSTGAGVGLVALDAGETTHTGGPAAGRRVLLPWGGNAFDINALSADGKTLMRRALEWAAGAAADPAGTVLLVVPDAGALSAQDTAKQALIESWGYSVTPVSASDSQAAIDAAVAGAGAVYVSEEITSADLGTKLTGAPVGVVNEEGALADELGIAATVQHGVVAGGEIIDNGHYVTFVFPTGTQTVVAPAQELVALGGGIAPELRVLGESSGGFPALSVLEAGAALAAGGGPATGRRLQLPWGGDTFDVDTLTAAGRAIMRRSIEWAAGAGPVAVTIVEVRVASAADDAEERVSNGNMTLGSPDLELIRDGAQDQIVGLRFAGLAVPQGATITSAWIQFRVDEVDIDAADLTFRVEAHDDAPPFTATSGDISDRATEAPSVAWVPPAWTSVGEEGPAQRTPDLSTLIQAVVDRPGWSNGNAAVVIVTGSGERTAESFEGSASGAPLLHVEYH